MNEHLVNNFEQFRNKVIKINEEMYQSQELLKDLDKCSLIKQSTREWALKKFLKAQDDLNNLYKEYVTYE